MHHLSTNTYSNAYSVPGPVLCAGITVMANTVNTALWNLQSGGGNEWLSKRKNDELTRCLRPRPPSTNRAYTDLVGLGPGREKAF